MTGSLRAIALSCGLSCALSCGLLAATPASAFDIGPDTCFDDATTLRHRLSGEVLHGTLVSFMTSTARDGRLGPDDTTAEFVMLECSTGEHVRVTGFSFNTEASLFRGTIPQDDYEVLAALRTSSMIGSLVTNATGGNLRNLDLRQTLGLYRERGMTASFGLDFGPTCACETVLKR